LSIGYNKTIKPKQTKQKKGCEKIMKISDMNFTGISENQIEDVKRIQRLINRAVTSWVNANNDSSEKTKDNSTYYYNRAEKLGKVYNNTLELDCGVGLYPTFEFIYNGEKYTEYNVENFFKRINGFWDWNKKVKTVESVE
jgi:hypothetical protein